MKNVPWKTKPPFPSILDKSHPLSKGLVGLWLFNEGAGLTAFDLSGNRNNGTLVNGPTWVAGNFGKALSFDGTNRLTLGTLTTGTTYTFSLWVNVVNSGTYNGLITESTNSGFFYRKALSCLTLYYGGGDHNFSSAIPGNKWIHAVVVNNAGDVTFYMNGVASGAATGAPSMNVVQFGNDTSNEGLIGSLDGVRIYNRALSASEIKQLYLEPFAGFTQPKIASVGFPLIGLDAASNSGYQAASSSYSWNHTCTGNNRYLVVGISMLSLAQTVSGITYNGVALTFLGSKNSVSGAARVELWGLIAPATGTNSIAVTLTGSIASTGNASSYTNVHQTSPTEAFNSAQATNVGAADATVDVTTVADYDMVVNVVATDDTVITVGAGQTQAGNVTGAGGSGAMSYA